MSYLVIFKLMLIIAIISCGLSLESARTQVPGLSSKQLTQTGIFGDLLNISFRGNDRYKFRSQDGQYFDPVLRNHSALADYVDRKDKKLNNYGDLEKLPVRRKRSTRLKCTDSCERSLCPWTMHWNEDATRVPQFIRYAKCETDYCNFSFAKLGLFTLFKLGMGTQCETVTTDIFTTKEGKENWITGWPIACICATVWSQGTSPKPFSSDTQRLNPQMTSNLEADAPSQYHDSEYEGNYMEENPNIYLGMDHSVLTDEQQERLLRQETLKKQLSESFEEVMKRERQE